MKIFNLYLICHFKLKICAARCRFIHFLGESNYFLPTIFCKYLGLLPHQKCYLELVYYLLHYNVVKMHFHFHTRNKHRFAFLITNAYVTFDQRLWSQVFSECVLNCGNSLLPFIYWSILIMQIGFADFDFEAKLLLSVQVRVLRIMILPIYFLFLGSIQFWVWLYKIIN